MSNNMNTSQARVIDPILSTHAQGYRNLEFIGHRLFPIVEIPVRGMQVLRFDKTSFRKMNTRRAPGARTERVQFGYASGPVALHQDALEGIVPWEHQEEATRVPGINLAKNGVEDVLNVIALGREMDIAKLVLDPNKYSANNRMSLTGADKWSDPSSDPAKDVKEAREQIRRRTGRYPNQFTMSPPVYNVLSAHPKIKEQFKYTSSDSVTAEMLAKYFEVDEVIVGKAVYLEDSDSDDADAKDVWGEDAVLSFTSKRGDYRTPSFGYTYRLKGHPMVEKPYSERNIKSWVYPVTEDWSPEMTGPDAGFLFRDPV